MRFLCVLLLLSAAASGQTFDVASVKSMKPEALGAGSEKIVVHPGSVSMRNIRLRGIVKWAYDVKEYQISAPAWMGSPGWQGGDLARFEILAKAADGTPVDQLRRMMKALLAERFHLVLHRETREIPVFVMTHVRQRPGLKPASEDAAPGISGNDSGFTLHAATLAEFTELMAGPLHAPVVDRTNRTGRFVLTVDFSGYQGDRGDEAGAMPLAIENQLGLKLERQKAPMEILIIDRADEKPTEN